MTPLSKLDEIEKSAGSKLLMQVAINTNDIEAVKDDIHQIREDIQNFRRESREDSKTTRQAIIAFASAVSVPILIAALKLAFFS